MDLLSESVLVLNKHYLAIQVTTAEDAVSAIVSERGKIVDETYISYTLSEWADFTSKNTHYINNKYPGIIHSPSITIFIPQVIMLLDCDYTTSIIRTVKYSRKNIYERDEYTCQYCYHKFNRKLLNLDHVVPKSRGGSNAWTNIVTSCLTCNQRKGNKLIKELGWKLKQKPTRPKWKSHIGTPFMLNKKKYWNNFLK